MTRPRPHTSCEKTLAALITANFRILRERPELAGLVTSGQSGMLSISVLLEDARVDELDPPTKDLRTYLLTSSSYTKENCRTLMENLLAVDEHLRTCCQSAYGLAMAIELHIPTALAAMSMGYDEGGVEKAVSQMIASLYEGNYQRHIYCHLYNFDTDCFPLPIHNSNLTLVKITNSDISELIGETTAYSYLHNSRTGTCFIRLSGNHPVDETEAFNEAWIKAHDLLRLLKYVKYGVIDIDYGSIYYHPSWVTRIRRPGLRFWGQPRRDIQATPYLLADPELTKLSTYLASYERLKPIIDGPKPTPLRLAGSIAGNFYEGHYRRLQEERDLKLIELVIALETLFSPGRDGGQRFRISQRAAILLGKDAKDRKALMDFFQLVYDARSQIVHTGISAFPPATEPKRKGQKTLNDQQLTDLGNYVRETVLKILILVWRDKKDKDEVNDLLDKSALDETSLRKLLQETDIESALQDLSCANPPVPPENPPS